jgi:hypothetical protein
MSSYTQLPELPSLDSGLHLLDADDHAVTALHALVLDHALSQHGDIYWVDAGRDAATTPLAQLAPSPRILERIQVARAFTPHQHRVLVQTASTIVDADAGLVVAPSFDAHYRADDLGHEEGSRLQVRSLAQLTGLARRHDLPVLLTRNQTDAFSGPLEEAADTVIEMERTQHGPRFVTDDFETLVYPEPGGFQTTITYWRRILTTRHPEAMAATPTGEVTMDGAY